MYAVKIKAKVFDIDTEFYIGDSKPILTYHGLFSGGLHAVFRKSEAKLFTKSEAQYKATAHGGTIEKIK